MGGRARTYTNDARSGRLDVVRGCASSIRGCHEAFQLTFLLTDCRCSDLGDRRQVARSSPLLSCGVHAAISRHAPNERSPVRNANRFADGIMGAKKSVQRRLSSEVRPSPKSLSDLQKRMSRRLVVSGELDGLGSHPTGDNIQAHPGSGNAPTGRVWSGSATSPTGNRATELAVRKPEANAASVGSR